MSIEISPIGHVRGGRHVAKDDDWHDVHATIELDGDHFQPDALAGLAEFSHIEVVFHFHQVAPDKIVTDARHPRGRSDWPKVGIFAQRGRVRPNRLGVSVCQLHAVDGLVLTVQGLDAIDGTPVIDIKPVMRGFAPRGAIREPDWAKEIMADYW